VTALLPPSNPFKVYLISHKCGVDVQQSRNSPQVDVNPKVGHTPALDPATTSSTPAVHLDVAQIPKFAEPHRASVQERD